VVTTAVVLPAVSACCVPRTRAFSCCAVLLLTTNLLARSFEVHAGGRILALVMIVPLVMTLLAATMMMREGVCPCGELVVGGFSARW
jgi:uncharacterized PurR-regulated membrane protein YhhQ (DUF165 family)